MLKEWHMILYGTTQNPDDSIHKKENFGSTFKLGKDEILSKDRHTHESRRSFDEIPLPSLPLEEESETNGKLILH